MRVHDEENWDSAYQDHVSIYEDFSRYEDADGAVLARLLRRASLDDKKVLEIGCGSGKYTRQLAEHSGRYAALDISAPLLELAKRKCSGMGNVEFLLADATEIPLPSASIDVVFSSWALDGIVPVSAREKALSECDRLLRRDSDMWVVGNDVTGAFMDMRGSSSIESDRFGYQFMLQHGFQHVDTIEARFIFPTLGEARRILESIFGANATSYLNAHPSPTLDHRVVLYHKHQV